MVWSVESLMYGVIRRSGHYNFLKPSFLCCVLQLNGLRDRPEHRQLRRRQCLCERQRLERQPRQQRYLRVCFRRVVSVQCNAAFTPVAGHKLYPLVSTCIPCRRLHISCIGDKIVVTATCIHLYPRVEHCLELLSVYMYPSTCKRIQVARPEYFYTATCIWCKRGLKYEQ